MSGVLLTNVMDLNDMSLLYNALIFVWGVVFQKISKYLYEFGIDLLLRFVDMKRVLT